MALGSLRISYRVMAMHCFNNFIVLFFFCLLRIFVEIEYGNSD